jgi:drug/metabolite transporter (DMT)-like permease
MTIIGAFAGLFLKRASGSSTIKDLVFNKNLYIGGGLYVLSALLNIYILKFLEYSLVLPLTSITYVWTMLVAYFFAEEKIGIKKILGIILVIIGAIVLVSG